MLSTCRLVVRVLGGRCQGARALGGRCQGARVLGGRCPGTRALTTGVGRPLQANLNKPKYSGVASIYRLPIQDTTEGLDACFVGVPFDCGTTYRPGARFGPSQIRTESLMVRAYNKDTGAMPFDSLNVADIGDVSMRPYYTPYAAENIREAYRTYIKDGCKTLTMGGDHTITYPILQAYKEKYGPVGLVHVDAHTDTNSEMGGCPIMHGTPFYRAVEEGLIEPSRVVQIGLRGTGFDLDELKWGQDKGFKLVRVTDCWHKSLVPLMEQVRAHIGRGPVYLSFDIDSLDPSFAPGTGTPEIGGLTTMQGLEIIRGCQGLDIVGCDLVEVAPAYDSHGNTAVLAANLLFEMLCVLPGVKVSQVPTSDFTF